MAVTPKAFLSYSWTTPEHSERVRILAERLLQDGVDAILDKWDLRPGDDAFAYMERMVTDETVTKVIIVSDERYAKKADGRDGGVGAEALIVSPKIYENTKQDKFGIVVTELDSNGKAIVPAFLSGRIYFNFADRAIEESEYESLLRWLHNKPLLLKPAVGKPPAHLDTVTESAAATLSAAHRTDTLLRNADPRAKAALLEYGDRLYSAFRSVKPDFNGRSDSIEDAVFDAIHILKPYVIEFRSLSELTARHYADAEVVQTFCDLLEKLAATMYHDATLTGWSDIQFDAQRYAIYEMFLSIVTSMIVYRRYDVARDILERSFYVEMAKNGAGPSTSDYTIFRPILQSFEARNNKSNPRLYSPIGGFLKDAVKDYQNLFENLMETDLILYIRSRKLSTERAWTPMTLVYAGNRYKPFPLFARAESMRVLNELLGLLGIESLQAFRTLMTDVLEKDGLRSSWDMIPLSALTNIEHLGYKS